jgi:hypothetical protein
LPDPHWPAYKAPSNNDGYYLGANWSNIPVTTYRLVEDIVGEERNTSISSTGSHQLLDPSSIQCVRPPFVSEDMGGYTWGAALLGIFTAYYHVTFKVRTGGTTRLWHYRVKHLQVFSRRLQTPDTQGGAGVDEPLMFLVVERYPYSSGTAYINDLPQVWIGVIDMYGRVVHTCRTWQYGLAGAELLAGNGHHVVWALLEGAINPQPRYFVTNLDSYAERAFVNQFTNTVLSGESFDQMAPNDIAWFTQANAKLFTPNFLWSDLVPERFFDPNKLPVTEEDKALKPYATLSGGQATGSTRMINDYDLLMPLGKWQAA